MESKKTTKQKTVDYKTEQSVKEQPQADPATTSNTVEKPVEVQLVEMVELLKRTRADFENFRKRADEQKEQAKQGARVGLVRQMLPVFDALIAAFGAYPELKPVEKSFYQTLASAEVTVVNPEVGAVFDPSVQEAISMETGEEQVEMVAETLRVGYLYQTDLVRPAMVKVKS